MNQINKASTERIKRDLETLSKYNSTPGQGITRVLFTETELRGRAFIKERMWENGLEVREDEIGNIFGKLSGENSGLAPVWTGSHIDTVLNAGMFDGTVGVIGGMEALRAIRESGLKHERDIEVIVYTSEEPTRFGLGCLGSRALAGELTAEEAKTLIDDGSFSSADEGRVSLYDVLENLGYDAPRLSNVKRNPGDVYGAVELHIEQGAVLEHLGRKIGVVSTISAPTDIKVKVQGIQEHAGATPMYLRKDALSAAAQMILQLEGFAQSAENKSTVATVGKVEVFPGATNVIPGEVNFTIDMRSSVMAEKEEILRKLDSLVENVSATRKVRVTKELVSHEAPADADPHIVGMLETICEESQVAYNKMVSGAYHDSMFLSKFAPFGMIFVPSRKGISHHMDEWTDFADIALGTDILAQALFQLSNER